ncbi:hypothetical protein D3C86_2201310 [compost metagenome]
MDAAAGASERFFEQTGCLLSERDVDVILDVVPLVYHVSEAEILEWDAGKGLRRYELAIARLGAKKG